MKVSRLPKDTGRSGWNAVLPEPAPPTPLLGTVTADWLVIGAGVAGLAAARRLAQIRDGDRIAVLDAVRVGTGPAGRNSGFMIDLPHDLASENYGGGIERDRTPCRKDRRITLSGGSQEGGRGQVVLGVFRVEGEGHEAPRRSQPVRG